MKSCSLHDLVRDLCVRKAREEKFLVYATDECANLRRLSITNSNNVVHNVCDSTIRTILCFRGVQESCLDILGAPKLLRVLEVANDSDEQLPFQILELFHLRYLASWKRIDTFPIISMLENLYTLIINRKTNPAPIPVPIWRMLQLRHLVIYSLYVDIPPSALPLKNLKTLLVASCSKGLLKIIPNVKKLGLICFDQLYNLTYLDQLEKLKVIMQKSFRVVQNPTFPRTLKKLTLSSGGFPWKDMSIIGSLPNLVVLKLINYACGGDTWETTDGEFLQLKFLLIEKSDLRGWIIECSHFPTLRCVTLRVCLCLSGIPDGIVEIPSLEIIEVDFRNKRLVESAKEILEDQRDQGINDPQVRIVGCLHESFSVEKMSGKKCYMIGARELSITWSYKPEYWQWKACADSRFSVVAELINVWWLDVSVKIKTYPIPKHLLCSLSRAMLRA